jgi:hypothetical protein
MNPADLARQNAIPLEVKKDGLQQRQNGDWVLRFVVQAADMDQRLTSAAMGTRFQVALVEIGDDELPKQKGKLDWRELQPAAQAGIRCTDPVFWKFLEEKHCRTIDNEDVAAAYVRGDCFIKSRSELGTNHKARVLWHQMDEHFQAWKAHENA